MKKYKYLLFSILLLITLFTFNVVNAEDKKDSDKKTTTTNNDLTPSGTACKGKEMIEHKEWKDGNNTYWFDNCKCSDEQVKKSAENYQFEFKGEAKNTQGVFTKYKIIYKKGPKTLSSNPKYKGKPIEFRIIKINASQHPNEPNKPKELAEKYKDVVLKAGDSVEVETVGDVLTGMGKFEVTVATMHDDNCTEILEINLSDEYYGQSDISNVDVSTLPKLPDFNADKSGIDCDKKPDNFNGEFNLDAQIKYYYQQMYAHTNGGEGNYVNWDENGMFAAEFCFAKKMAEKLKQHDLPVKKNNNGDFVVDTNDSRYQKSTNLKCSYKVLTKTQYENYVSDVGNLAEPSNFVGEVNLVPSSDVNDKVINISGSDNFENESNSGYFNASYFHAKEEKTNTMKVEYQYHLDPNTTITKSVNSCVQVCEEAVKVLYYPPQVAKGGICFSYKVKVESYVNCNVTGSPEKPIQGIKSCNPRPRCIATRLKGRITEGGGPDDDYEDCIEDCDGGKYTSKCSTKCYNKVYKKTTSKTSNYNYDITATQLSNQENKDYDNEWCAKNGCYKRINPTSDGKVLGNKIGKNESYVAFKSVKSSYTGCRWSRDKENCSLTYLHNKSYVPGFWYDNHSTSYGYQLPGNGSRVIGDSIYDYQSGNGILRWNYGGNIGFCTDNCWWEGTDCNGLYLNEDAGYASKFDKNGKLIKEGIDDRKNREAYEQAINQCKQSLTCSRSTAEFEIGANYTEKGSKKVQTIKYPYSKKTDTVAYNNKTTACPKSDVQGKIINTPLNPSHKDCTIETSIVDYGGCYLGSQTNRYYMTEWTFPGVYKELKNDYVEYGDKSNDTSYGKVPGKFCVKENTQTVNGKWALWATKVKNEEVASIEKENGNENYDAFLAFTKSSSKKAQECGSTYDEISTTKDVFPPDKDPKDVVRNDNNDGIWNIWAHTKNFGYFSWDIWMHCFYGGYDNPNSPDTSGKNTSKNESNCKDNPQCCESKDNYQIVQADPKNLLGTGTSSDDNTKMRMDGEIPANFSKELAVDAKYNEDNSSNGEEMAHDISEAATNGELYEEDNLEFIIELNRDSIMMIKNNNNGSTRSSKFELDGNVSLNGAKPMYSIDSAKNSEIFDIIQRGFTGSHDQLSKWQECNEYDKKTKSCVKRSE